MVEIAQFGKVQVFLEAKPWIRVPELKLKSEEEQLTLIQDLVNAQAAINSLDTWHYPFEEVVRANIEDDTDRVFANGDAVIFYDTYFHTWELEYPTGVFSHHASTQEAIDKYKEMKKDGN